jgi:YesN/AraC family two-component response regulator
MENKLLIVDDEDNIRNALNRELKDENYDILFAKNGKEGLDLVNYYKPNVILSDLKMPEMNGIQFLAEAKKICPDSVSIILTAYSERELVLKAVSETGMWQYLLKPWDTKKLIKILRDAFLNYKTTVNRNEKYDSGKKVYFLYPPSVVEEKMIIEIIDNEYEVYVCNDHKKANIIFSKHKDSIVFINIDKKIRYFNWDDYIKELMKDPVTKNIKIGILTYNTDEKLKKKYLMDYMLSAGFIQLDLGFEKSRDIILKALEANEARGMRKYVRAICSEPEKATFNILLFGKYFSGRIIDICSASMACVFKEKPKVYEDAVFEDIQLQLRGALLKTAGVVRTIRRNNNSEVFVIEFIPHLDGKNKLFLCSFIHYSLQKYLEITTSNIKRLS